MRLPKLLRDYFQIITEKPVIWLPRRELDCCLERQSDRLDFVAKKLEFVCEYKNKPHCNTM